MDGLIIINKAKGGSSQHEVSRIKHIVLDKAGHCGTLDPGADGVLPVCVGKATRLSAYIMGQRKRYVGEVCFGRVTDSYDADGARLSESDASFVTAEQVEALLPRFCGQIWQRPPIVSALKRDGEPLYKKARRGESVEIEPRQVQIYALRVLDFTADGAHPRCRLEVECGQGAYIRSLAHDLGQALGCGAYLTALTRTRVGEFDLERSYSVEQVKEMQSVGDRSFLIPMERAVRQLPAVTCPPGALRRVVHGNECRLESGDWPCDTPLRVLHADGRLLGLGHVRQDEDAPRLVMDKVLVDVEEYFPASRAPRLSVAAIGNFDGLHLGHRALFEQVSRLRDELGGASAMLTFSPHPLTLVSGRPPALLLEEQLKDRLAQEYFNIDQVVTLPFDQRLMALSPAEFVEETVVRTLGVQQLVVGFNFTFAARAAGTADTLRQLCVERHIGVSVVEAVDSPWGVVSSTNIREHLRCGDMDAVNAMLGFWLPIEGRVVHGRQLGRSIGFPTANLLPAVGQALPPYGVYAGRAEHQGRTYPAVINFGVKPTVGGEKTPLFEAHLLDVELDLYGDTLRLYLGRFLRPEQRFNSLDELSRQIAADSAACGEFLSGCAENKHLPNPLR